MDKFTIIHAKKSLKLVHFWLNYSNYVITFWNMVYRASETVSMLSL